MAQTIPDQVPRRPAPGRATRALSPFDPSDVLPCGTKASHQLRERRRSFPRRASAAPDGAAATRRCHLERPQTPTRAPTKESTGRPTPPPAGQVAGERRLFSWEERPPDDTGPATAAPHATARWPRSGDTPRGVHWLHRVVGRGCLRCDHWMIVRLQRPVRAVLSDPTRDRPVRAVLSAPACRARHGTGLAMDHPRIPFPANVAALDRMSALGNELNRAYQLQAPLPDDVRPAAQPPSSRHGPLR